MLESDLVTIIRDDYKFDISSISDADLTRLIAKSAKKVSEFFPLRGLSYIETVKDQTRYTVSTITNLLRIAEVYYDGVDTSLPVTNFFNSNFGRTFDSRNMSTFALSQNMEFVQRLQTLKHMLPVCAQVIDYNRFDLIPTPGSDGLKVYFDYEYYRGIADVPMIFEDEVLQLIMYYSTEGDYHKRVTKPSHNNYNFDRRGNATTGGDESSSASIEMKSRKDFIKEIEKSIRKKVIKLT